MLIVTGEVDAKEGAFDALLAAGRAHSARSRAEPGCIGHRCYVDPDTPGRIFFFERWADQPALDAHFATAGVIEVMAAFRAHAAWTSGLGVFTVSEG